MGMSIMEQQQFAAMQKQVQELSLGLENHEKRITKVERAPAIEPDISHTEPPLVAPQVPVDIPQFIPAQPPGAPVDARKRRGPDSLKKRMARGQRRAHA